MHKHQDQLFLIMEELRKLGLIRSSTDFSIDWLGREGGYMRCLRAKKRRPSSQVLATCAVRLLQLADRTAPGSSMGASNRNALRAVATLCLDALLDTGLAPKAVGKKRQQEHPI